MPPNLSLPKQSQQNGLVKFQFSFPLLRVQDGAYLEVRTNPLTMTAMCVKEMATGVPSRPNEALQNFHPQHPGSLDGFNLAYLPDREHRTIHHGEEFFKPENGLLVAKIFKMPNPESLVFEDDNIKVFAFTVPHGPIHGAVGYRIVVDDRSVVISGDTDVMKDYNFLNLSILEINYLLQILVIFLWLYPHQLLNQ